MKPNTSHLSVHVMYIVSNFFTQALTWLFEYYEELFEHQMRAEMITYVSTFVMVFLLSSPLYLLRYAQMLMHGLHLLELWWV